MGRHKQRSFLAVVAVVALGGALGTVEAAEHPREVIIEWNQILQGTIPASASVGSFRYYAMMHIAMFDAVNSIERDFERYHAQVFAHPAASSEAAAAQAARDVLAELIPTAQPTFDAALQARLGGIQPLRAALGVAVGKKVARAVLDWRTGDGSEQPNRPYLPPALPGLWQPTSTGQVAAFVHFAGIEPFGLLTPTQYLPDPPPLLNSAEYAQDFATVKEIGSVNSSTRSADQTLVAKLIAASGYGPGPFALWSHVARDVARSRNLSLVKTARLFAMLNVAMNDGLQTSHVSKFVYGLWRPITAIRRADEDANDQTMADPAWTPLLATPPYPSHSSNLTCIATSAARSIARMLGTDAVPFTVTWTGTGGNPNETRSYTALSQLAEESALSRVWGGIHFLFELTESAESCTKVADYIADNYMQPTFHWFH
jgi:hypothetical protein